MFLYTFWNKILDTFLDTFLDNFLDMFLIIFLANYIGQFYRHFYFSEEWNYAIEAIINVLFLVGRAHRGKKNALFVQKFMVWWALSRINRARRTNVKKRQKKSEIEKPDFAMTAIGALHLCCFLAVGSWIAWFISSWDKNYCCYKPSKLTFFGQNGQVWKYHYF